MDAALISAVIDVLALHLKASPDSLPEVLLFLEQLPNVGRFSLNIGFWGKTEKQALIDLLQQVSNAGGDTGQVAGLTKAYGC
jgi:hypothetical protein